MNKDGVVQTIGKLVVKHKRERIFAAEALAKYRDLLEFEALRYTAESEEWQTFDINEPDFMAGFYLAAMEFMAPVEDFET